MRGSKHDNRIWEEQREVLQTGRKSQLVFATRLAWHLHANCRNGSQSKTSS